MSLESLSEQHRSLLLVLYAIVLLGSLGVKSCDEHIVLGPSQNSGSVSSPPNSSVSSPQSSVSSPMSSVSSSVSSVSSSNGFSFSISSSVSSPASAEQDSFKAASGTSDANPRNTEDLVQQLLQLRQEVPESDRIDSDLDGLYDYEEEIVGTDPYNPDTDNDGFLDGFEFWSNFDPLDPYSHPPYGFPLSAQRQLLSLEPGVAGWAGCPGEEANQEGFGDSDSAENSSQGDTEYRFVNPIWCISK